MAETTTIQLEITKEELQQQLISYMVAKHEDKLEQVGFKKEIIDSWKEVIEMQVDELYDLMDEWEVEEQIADMKEDLE